MSFTREDGEQLVASLLMADKANHMLRESFPHSGATLVRKTREGDEVMGVVVASPNVPRPYNSAFDSDDGDRTLLGNDWFEKIIYVNNKDARDFAGAVEGYRLMLEILRKGLDHIDAEGCSPGARSVKLIRLGFDADGKPSLHAPEGPYAAIVAKFFGGTGMAVKEYWVSTDAASLLKTPECGVALERSKATVDPSSPAVVARRAGVTAHLSNLAHATVKNPFD